MAAFVRNPVAPTGVGQGPVSTLSRPPVQVPKRAARRSRHLRRRRWVPVTTHVNLVAAALEQTNCTRQSGTGVSAPVASSHLGETGLDLMLALLAPRQ
jgi:hypothetical protein